MLFLTIPISAIYAVAVVVLLKIILLFIVASSISSHTFCSTTGILIYLQERRLYKLFNELVVNSRIFGEVIEVWKHKRYSVL